LEPGLCSDNMKSPDLASGIKTFHAKTQKEWRKWLGKNHRSEKAVWLIFYKKGSGIPSTNYAEALEEALCFGWIDSKANKRDDESYYQYFAKRKPGSNWSRVNKEKVAKLIEKGLMTPAGFESVETAKQNGKWSALDEVEKLIVPSDLKQLFDKNKTASENWNGFSRSVKRGILEWILNAKRAETRQRRIAETVDLAEKNIKANF
jgi:uncharacterized protein YdeI (YjbR/CyaY-like superfamily)